MPRAAGLRAFVFDLALLAGLQAATATVAVLVFLIQSGGGERDLTSSAATTGWAIALAAVPAWLGLLGQGYAAHDGTPGQHRAGLAVEGTPLRRLVRLALHPVGMLGWGWLALVSALAALTGLALLFASAAVIVALGGLASGAIVLARPGSLPLHDRIAGTRLVVR